MTECRRLRRRLGRRQRRRLSHVYGHGKCVCVSFSTTIGRVPGPSFPPFPAPFATNNTHTHSTRSKKKKKANGEEEDEPYGLRFALLCRRRRSSRRVFNVDYGAVWWQAVTRDTKREPSRPSRHRTSRGPLESRIHHGLTQFQIYGTFFLNKEICFEALRNMFFQKKNQFQKISKLQEKIFFRLP